jgi:sugar lactone lactonase YvrE
MTQFRLSLGFLLFLLLFCGSAAPADRVVLIAGGTGGEGGKATDAKLDGPFGVDFDEARNLYLVEISGHRVLKIDPSGVLTRLGGTGQKGNGGDGGPALKAEFNGMHSLAVATGQIYVADTWNNRIRSIDLQSGQIHAVAGTGTKGFSGDGGPAVKAEFGGIYCVALDSKGNRLVLTDLDNRRIRVVDLKSGLVTTVAGNGEKGKPQDGAVAKDAPLVDPRAAVADSRGNLYILERGGHALRVVDSGGKTRTLIGDGKGDTTLKGPKHLCVDRTGDVMIADTENHRVIKYIVAEKRTVPIAGTGQKGTAGIGGPPTQIQLNQPHGVTFGPDGQLLIVDSTNNRVLKIESSAK